MVADMARYTEQVFQVKKLVPLTTELAERISEYRHANRISSENEAIRRLIETGLKAGTIPIRGTKPEPCADSGESDGSVEPRRPK